MDDFSLFPLRIRGSLPAHRATDGRPLSVHRVLDCVELKHDAERKLVSGRPFKAMLMGSMPIGITTK